jgi:Transposase DDE domain/Domain of unknown function (DUF4372)
MNTKKSKYTILSQICKIIPKQLVPMLAKKHGVDKRARKFTPWSHVVTLLFTQLAHSLSLNDVADTLSAHRSLGTIRSACPPSRNNLSHANKVRNSDMAEELFWETLKYLESTPGRFGMGKKYSGIPRRFKKTVYAIDSTTIQLVANCVDWAKHRRRKAAAKCHMNLNLQTFLPHFAIVKTAASSDATEAWKVCSTLKDGEIAVFDKAYVDYKHLFALNQRGIFWVTRKKSNMTYRVVGQHSAPKNNIHKDVVIELTNTNSKKSYPETMRLVEATVLIDGKEKLLTFITNNMAWAPSSVCDLYKCRWGVEVFFKQIKQTLQLADFLGQSENAVKWQIWTALLTYILLRFISYDSKWSGSFSRLFTLLRGTLWSNIDMKNLIESYGTATDPPRTIATPAQVYLPGILI